MQPAFEIKHHPVDLARHGMNPYGQSIYRVVWADTRMSKVICRGKKFEFPRYRHEPETVGCWVLEKWAPAETIVGMTRENYESMVAAVANAAVEEYPERGEYELSGVFNQDFGPLCRYVDEVALHKQLDMHEARFRNTTTGERTEEFKANEDLKEKVQDEVFDNMFEEGREETLNAQ